MRGIDDVLVANGDNARLKRDQAVEQIALHVFGVADCDGKLITRRMVTERLSELSAHTTAAGAVYAISCRR